MNWNVELYTGLMKLLLQGSLGFYLHPSVAVPTNSGSSISRSHAAIHLLAALDTLNLAHDLDVKVAEDDVKKNEAVTYR